MPETLFKVDLTKSMDQQDMPGHNRWHPDIPAVASVNPGDVFRIECKYWTDGQIKDNDNPQDIADVNLEVVHVLSGPIWVNGAQPGDILVVDILEVGALQGDEWGFTGIFAKENGGGFLTDHFPKAAKAIWDLEGVFTSSRHIPGVRFAGITHPGLIGCAPSMELLQEWNRRETELVQTAPDRRTYGAGLSGTEPVLAALPNPNSAILGNVAAGDFERIANEAARTVPPREHGGNCDIKNLTKGTRIYFPVYVEGAKLSMGDIHFSQGDGEITFCGAIEMAGYLDIRVSLIKQGVQKYGVINPIFEPSPIKPDYKEHLIFEGISVDETTGEQYYLDAHVSYRRACLNAIEYMKKFGYTGEQAYAILGTAPVQGHISGIVDIPNACATLHLPQKSLTLISSQTPKVRSTR